MPSSDSQVREISRIRPRLRADLRYTFQEYRRKRCCIIEDPTTGHFHRIGMPEYRLLRFFNGECPFGEAHVRASLQSGRDALTESQALSL
ncbi:MAG: hypothetical protein ACQKBT_08740, partial [Puniceicoccales bacterium]